MDNDKTNCDMNLDVVNVSRAWIRDNGSRKW